MLSGPVFVAFGFAFIQLGLAWIVQSVRPRRLANGIVAALFLLNGVLVGLSGARVAAWWPGSRPVETLLDSQTYVLLLLLALAFPRPRLRPRALAAVAVVASVGFAALALLAATGPPPGVTVLSRGAPLRVLAFDAAGLVTLAVGTVVLLDSYLGAASDIQRGQARYVLAAFAAKLAIVTAVLWRDGAGRTLLAWDAPLLASLAFAAVVCALAAVPTGVVVSRLRGASADRALAEDMFVVGFPLFGIGIIAFGLDATVESLLLRPLLLAYGMLRFQLLDVEAHRHRRLLVALGAVAAGEIFVAVQWSGYGGRLDPVTAGGIALTATLVTIALLAPPIVRRLGGGGDAGARARAVYMAALEESIAREPSRGSSTDRVLRALRGRLQISDREAAAMEASARAVLAGSDGGPLVGYAFLGRYRVEAVLGEGGFGRAYLARDEQVDRRVVLKVARVPGEEEGARLLAEARILARVHHPNVVTIFDVERVGDDCVLVLEHVEGGSLADRLRAGPLTPREALAVADDVLAGLDALHERGVVHRDVKPANVLLRRDGRAVLSDFGIARAPTGTGTAASYGLGGANAGSLRYMAPEQVRGARVTPACDLYATAVLLHEMLTGRSYLDLTGRADYEAARAIVEEEPPRPLPGVPEGVEPLIRAGLAKDPGDRPASAGEMRIRLAAAAGAARA